MTDKSKKGTRNKTILQVRKYVKVHRDRGYGDGLFIVQAERGFGISKELELVVPCSVPFWIYEAHTYRDSECTRATLADAAERKRVNQQIGLRRRVL